MAKKWSITPNTASIDDDGVATFEKLDYEVTYTIKYDDGANGTGQTEYIVPKCEKPPTECASEWNLTLFGVLPPLVQNYTGTGGTPIQMKIYHNGEIAPGLTAEDFVLNIGQNGEYNEILIGLKIIQQGSGDAPYVIAINKANEDVTCKYIGKELTCTIAPTACTEATLNFTIKIDEKETWTTYITGLQSNAKPMGLTYCCKLSRCGIYLRQSFDDFNWDDQKQELYKTTPLYKNIDPNDITICALSQLPIGMQQAPECIRIDSTDNHQIRAHYCTDCNPTQHPCNQNYVNHCP